MISLSQAQTSCLIPFCSLIDGGLVLRSEAGELLVVDVTR
jgi:hypothetical protein